MLSISTQDTHDAYRLRNEQHWGERPLGNGGGMGEVATWNKAARLLVNSGHGGFPVAVHARIRKTSRPYIDIMQRVIMRRRDFALTHFDYRRTNAPDVGGPAVTCSGN